MYDYDDGRYLIRKIMIICVLVTTLIMALWILCTSIDKEQEKKNAEWNNGYCSECNEKYELIDTVTGYTIFVSDTDYIYEYPKCHKHIRTETLDNK